VPQCRLHLLLALQPLGLQLVASPHLPLLLGQIQQLCWWALCCLLQCQLLLALGVLCQLVPLLLLLHPGVWP
jgi:hypothetical protein